MTEDEARIYLYSLVDRYLLQEEFEFENADDWKEEFISYLENTN